jgi:hypothetical protein
MSGIAYITRNHAEFAREVEHFNLEDTNPAFFSPGTTLENKTVTPRKNEFSKYKDHYLKLKKDSQFLEKAIRFSLEGSSVK